MYMYTQFNYIHTQFLELPPVLSATQTSLLTMIMFMNAMHGQLIGTYMYMYVHVRMSAFHIKIQSYCSFRCNLRICYACTHTRTYIHTHTLTHTYTH